MTFEPSSTNHFDSIAAIRFVIAVVVAFAGCKDTSNPLNADTQPHITAIAPAHGHHGSHVIISGKNFSAIKDSNVVAFLKFASYFTAVAKIDSIVKGSSGDRLYVTVPDDAISGKILLAVHSGGSFDGVYSDSVFTVDSGSVPRVTSMGPSSGVIGSKVTIIGTGFDLGAANVRVMFDTSVGVIVRKNIDTVVVRVPPHVATAQFTIFMNADTLRTQAFTVLQPEIIAFAPSSGIPGTVVLLHTKFVPDSAATVTVTGMKARIDTLTDSTILFTVPEAAQNGMITVHNAAYVVTSTTPFTVLAREVIEIVPTQGCPTTPITIKTNFDVSNAKLGVTIGGAVVAITSQKDSTVVVSAPGIVGSGKVVLTMSGVSVKSDALFTVDDCPIAITKFEPVFGRENDSVKIYTTNIADTIGLVVKFGNVPSRVSFLGNGVLKAIVPAGAHTAPITVIYHGLQVTTDSTFIVRGPGFPFDTVSVEIGNVNVKLFHYHNTSDHGNGSSDTSSSVENFTLAVDPCNYAGALVTNARQLDSMGVKYSYYSSHYESGGGCTRKISCVSTRMIYLDTTRHLIRSFASGSSYDNSCLDDQFAGRDDKHSATLSFGTVPYSVLSDGTCVAVIRGMALSSIGLALSYSVSDGTQDGHYGYEGHSITLTQIVGFTDSSYVQIKLK